jgi:hypothetical protein
MAEDVAGTAAAHVIDKAPSSRSGRPYMIEGRRERPDVLRTLRQERVEPYQLVTLRHIWIIQNRWIYGLGRTAINAIGPDVRKFKNADYRHPVYKVKFVRPIMVIRVHMKKCKVPVYFLEYLDKARPERLISDTLEAVDFNHDLLDFLKCRLVYSQKRAKFRALHVHFHDDPITRNRMTSDVIFYRE